MSSSTSSNNTNTNTPRYTGPPLDEMTSQQKEIRDFILESRPRTGLSGPFGPWLAVPDIAKPASELGKACRYDTSLSFKESELVILLAGAKCQSATEFAIHTGEALKAGMSMEQIEAIDFHNTTFSAANIQQNLVPLLETEREKAIAMFTTELLETSTVSEETYNRTKTVLDDKDSVLVEITSITGYYIYVSYTLNVFNIQHK
mmetsp:Transcript_786/g.1212  ORF Transcript_786/g.1212 Transcript_786/m.1212 type:complete len:203 (-) Transcript_786:301-909(-)|eukprot:CAMPEP_0194224132 /NCGR_PEP_ID=MMETSP0156-20130528/36749_1 /TAXON_ID=33649 /ORGANISM="Thalassionema nitzschioides, Strain L26-B" /LENGTH=202 /DNA_ID=CAMNT_0038955557 /DNA_START=231 /DNA_END=839 /DNA_ORIENTATION=+